MTFRETLTRRMIFFDGAMGTALQAQGLKGGESPESWNLARPEVLITLHRQFLDAGCDVITANTFGANPVKMSDFTPRTGGEGSVAQTVTAAVSNVKTAIKQWANQEAGGRKEETAQQVKPHSSLLAPHNCKWCALDIGPTGNLLEPNGELSFEDAVKAFAVPIRAGAKAGADLIILETFTDPYEMKAAILAAKENCDLPVIASLSPDKDGKLLTGGGFDVIAALAEGLGVDAVALNCGFGPDVMARFARELSELCSLPILIMPNAGLPRMENGATFFDISPQDFANQMAEIAKIPDVCMLGGCCGTTPGHLRETISVCKNIKPMPPKEKKRTVVCSYAKSVEVGKGNIVIGERINPTGKKKLQAALREGDWEYIAAQGISQRNDGADILDVNCGLPGIDEATAMRKAVQVLQTALSLPLQLDSASSEALEAGLREYNGIALVNSVSGKEESLAQVPPLVKKYGGVLVCLTLDEAGIPETAEGRLAIARKIVDRAEQYGIERHRLLIDPLCMTVSADVNAAAVTLESLRLIKRELGVGTILGVSNVSFGLPNREAVSAAFFAQALSAGLDAAIINPGSQAMQTALLTYRLLTGQDENCAEYIKKMAGVEVQANNYNGTPRTLSPTEELTLHDAVLQGLEGQAYTLAAEQLKKSEANAVLNDILIPALEEVGEKFAAGTLFLPQLMQSAKAAQEVSRAVKEAMEQSGVKPEPRGRIILATVEGDVHDIGKNIVRVMLENYGFDVLDLGKNIPAGDVLAAVLQDIEQFRQNAGANILDSSIPVRELRAALPLVGLSALMTTTVPAMKQTVALLKENVPDIRVLVGGAVLSARTAKDMGADGYASDAMGAVELALGKLCGRSQT